MQKYTYSMKDFLSMGVDIGNSVRLCWLKIRADLSLIQG